MHSHRISTFESVSKKSLLPNSSVGILMRLLILEQAFRISIAWYSSRSIPLRLIFYKLVYWLIDFARWSRNYGSPSLSSSIPNSWKFRVVRLWLTDYFTLKNLSSLRWFELTLRLEIFSKPLKYDIYLCLWSLDVLSSH